MPGCAALAARARPSPTSPHAGRRPEPQLSLRKARFVRDTAAFLQNARDPARDVFTHASAAVASVCCVPLLVGDTPFGALYLTQEAACDFLNIQEALLVSLLF